MNRTWKLIASLLTVLCCIATRGNAQVIPIVGTIAEATPVTLLPGSGLTPLATLQAGAQVRVLGAAEQGWYRISFQQESALGSRIGYVRAEHVRVSRSDLAALALHNGLAAEEIVRAVSAGRVQKGGRAGVRLREIDERPVQPSSGKASRASLRLDIHTPLAWIQQLASDAARDNLKFNLEDVTAEMSASVLHITVCADAPQSAPDPHASVRSVVLRAADSAVVIQPLTTEAFSERRLTASGGAESSEVLRATFPLAAVRELRGPTHDGEFFITVTDADGEERDVRVRRADLTDLTM